MPQLKVPAEQALDEELGDLTALLNNLGGVLRAKRNAQAAHQAYLRALEILERCLPANHRTVRVVRRNLERLES
jgi:hypothetical protein